jgi:hypothetical protein
MKVFVTFLFVFVASCTCGTTVSDKADASTEISKADAATDAKKADVKKVDAATDAVKKVEVKK